MKRRTAQLISSAWGLTVPGAHETSPPYVPGVLPLISKLIIGKRTFLTVGRYRDPLEAQTDLSKTSTSLKLARVEGVAQAAAADSATHVAPATEYGSEATSRIQEVLTDLETSAPSNSLVQSLAREAKQSPLPRLIGTAVTAAALALGRGGSATDRALAMVAVGETVLSIALGTAGPIGGVIAAVVSVVSGWIRSIILTEGEQDAACASNGRALAALIVQDMIVLASVASTPNSTSWTALVTVGAYNNAATAFAQHLVVQASMSNSWPADDHWLPGIGPVVRPLAALADRVLEDSYDPDGIDPNARTAAASCLAALSVARATDDPDSKTFVATAALEWMLSTLGTSHMIGSAGGQVTSVPGNAFAPAPPLGSMNLSECATDAGARSEFLSAFKRAFYT